MAARGHHGAVRIDQDATPNVAAGGVKAGIAIVASHTGRGICLLLVPRGTDGLFHRDTRFLAHLLGGPL